MVRGSLSGWLHVWLALAREGLLAFAAQTSARLNDNLFFLVLHSLLFTQAFS